MILHITTRAAWDTAVTQNEYRDASLETEGFIHCSTVAQVLGPANAFYRGQKGLVLLGIDPALLDVPVVYEDCYETGQAFPHIYGPLPVTAVIQIFSFPPNPDGTFSLPPELG